MRALCWLTIVLYISGCTSMRPVELPADELQQQIINGEVFDEGEKARIVTADEVEYACRVRRVTTEIVGCDDTEIPIEDIVAVETREFSGGKTVLLGVGAVSMLYLIATAVATATLLSAGGGI